MNNKILTIGLVVAIIIALGAYMFPRIQGSVLLGGVSNFDTVQVTGLIVGSSATNSTNISFQKTGTCSLIASAYTSLAASTTIAMDCAATGAVTGDVVFAQFATSTNVGAGWLVTQASASTTAGFLTLSIVNNTGAAATIPASVASTTKYLVLRTQTTNSGL